MASAHNFLLFDVQPQVYLFPILSIEAAKNWNGERYDAIVVCERFSDEAHIGPLRSATVHEIDVARQCISELCKFVAHAVLPEDSDDDDSDDDDDNDDDLLKDDSGDTCCSTKTHATVPIEPNKAVFTISFAAADASKSGRLYPAPCPMLLGFKSCQNWCDKYGGFKIIEEEDELVAASTDVSDEDDAVDLFEENKVHRLSSLESYMRYAYPAKTKHLSSH